MSEWVSVRIGIHRPHSHSSDSQNLSERCVKSTPPSSATHLFGLFIRLKFCFKNGYFEKARGGREYFQGQALSSRQIWRFEDLDDS